MARVIVSDEQAKEIEKYYQQCAAEGSNPEQIEESKRAMSRMSAILGHPERLKKLAADVVTHYESLCAEKPEVVQKAMIVCADRPLAFKVLKAIEAIRPEWFVKKKAEHEDQLTREQLDKLVALPMINMVATQGQNDEKELYDLCGTKEYRKMLDRQFKNNDSNFRIAVVVDMWITGFDVPSLAVMYIDTAKGMPYINAVPNEIFVGYKCNEHNKKELRNIANKLGVPVYLMQYKETASGFELSKSIME